MRFAPHARGKEEQGLAPKSLCEGECAEDSIMSMKVENEMPQSFTRPTRHGNRRRPRSREMELVRPSAVYRAALGMSFARMSVIDKLRDSGFSA
jgi:hypothetical protein